MNKKQIYLNIIANALAMVVSTGINFFLTPFITETVGTDAYGFVTIAANFVSYVSLITTAFNSMGNRFITVELHKGNRQTANEYFSTVFFLNLGLAVVTSTIFLVLLLCLNWLLAIPKALYGDVILLFALTFASSVFALITSVFATATFCKNRLDLKSVVSIVNTVVRLILMVVLFGLFPAKVYYIGLSHVILNIIDGGINIFICRRIMGELEIKKEDFRRGHIRTLFSSGVWNAIGHLSSTLMTGLDLWVANVFINPTDSGVLSIAKLMPSLLYVGVSIIVTSFAPQFVQDYAKDSSKGTLVNTMDYSAKLSSFFSAIPVAGFIGFSFDFFRLWVPQQDAGLLQVLAIMTMLGDVLSYPVLPINNVFTAANKVRWPAVATLICGLLNVASMIPLLMFTNLGLYAVAGTSVVLLLLKDLFFKIPYVSKLVNVHPWHYWQFILRYIVVLGVVIGISWGIRTVLPVSGWGMLIVDAIITAVLSLPLDFIIVFNREERRNVLSALASKLKRKPQER